MNLNTILESFNSLIGSNTKWLSRTNQTQQPSVKSARKSRTQPMKSINGRSVLNPDFRYVKACETDLNKSFEIYRKELKCSQQQQ